MVVMKAHDGPKDQVSPPIHTPYSVLNTINMFPREKKMSIKTARLRKTEKKVIWESLILNLV